MSGWSTREELVHQVVTLNRQRLSRRAIARALGISRNTVRKILRLHAKARTQEHCALPNKPVRAPTESKLTPHHGRVDELLASYPDITAQRVFEELRGDGFDGGYTIVKTHVRKVRPKPSPTPSKPTPTWGPGEMAECDWSPYTIDFTVTGRATVQVFAYVLCFSHRKSFLVYESSDFYALIDGHTRTFELFEGVAGQCKYDGQKAVVLGWEGSQPIFNPRFLAYATHYDMKPVACRPRHPNDKPRVERGFWELERSFFNGRSFRDIDDLRAQLAAWQRDTCDLRLHKKLKRTALDLFAKEAPHLLPLPRHPYDTARVVYRVCTIDGFVAWDGNRYAVPYDHVTDLLPVRITQSELFIYAPNLDCVAVHELAHGSAGVDVDPLGVHPPWERRGANLEQLRAAFDNLGEDAAAFFTALATADRLLCGHHARQILQLRERYSTHDLCAALRHARSFGALEHHAIRRILDVRATPRTLAEYVAEETARNLEERLGRCNTTPRDLDEYDRLPIVSSQPEQPWPDEDHPDRHPTSSSSDSEDT